MSGFAGKEKAVQDLQGNWWYQDFMTASWYIWNGQDWKWMPGAAPRFAPRKTPSSPGSPLSWSFMFTAFTVSLLVLIIISGISLVAFNFFPAYHINPGKGDIVQIGKLGGGGLLVAILGLFMLYAGFRTFITPRTTANKKDRGREKRGCGTILNSLGQLFFGLLFLSGGLGMIMVVVFQEVLPWFGF